MPLPAESAQGRQQGGGDSGADIGGSGNLGKRSGDYGIDGQRGQTGAQAHNVCLRQHQVHVTLHGEFDLAEDGFLWSQ